MNNVPAELRYAQNREWARLKADGSVIVGISDHAREALSNMIFVELPELGRTLAVGQEADVVESVKAASDTYSPIDDEIIAINEALADTPEDINNDPYASWFFKPKPSNPAELDKPLDVAGYQTAVDAEG